MAHPVVSRRKVQAFRAAFDGPVADLASTYRHASANVLELLSDAKSSLFQRRRAKALLRQFHEVLSELRDESAAWISANMPACYQAGMRFGDEGLRGIRRAGINLGTPESVVFAGVHREAVEVMATAMQRTVDHALAQIGRRADDLFRSVGVQEVAKGIAEGKTRVQVSREMKQRFLAEGRLQFLDKRGRAWDLDNYTEMVARTTTREAMTQGTINRLREHGIELAQVSAHGAADFCLYYENMVVSIGSEPHPVYPSIDSIGGGPPFHPRCVHVLTPFVEALATPDERGAGESQPGVLYKTPAELQRRFRRDFPARAKAEGRRIRQEGAVGRRRAEKRAKREERIAGSKGEIISRRAQAALNELPSAASQKPVRAAVSAREEAWEKRMADKRPGETPRERLAAARADEAEAGKRAARQLVPRKLEALYQRDETFRSVADGLADFTQGNYSDMRDASASLVRKGNMSEFMAARGADYSVTPARGISLMGDSLKGAVTTESLEVQARAINDAIRRSPVRAEPIYRGEMVARRGLGVNAVDPHYMKLKVGETYEVHGATSFTTRREVAADFAAGTNPGSSIRRHTGREVIFEVRGETQGIHADIFSPWDQAEVVTNGRFRVDAVRDEVTDLGRARRIITLTQEQVL